MGAKTVLTGDQQEPQPCDTCCMQPECDKRDLACAAYFHWVSYGRYQEPSGIATRTYFEALSAETKAEAGGAYSRAMAQEQRIRKYREQRDGA